MKIRTNTLLFVPFLLAAFVNVVHAEDDRTVWHDSDGEAVHNSWGSCVRGMWLENQDECEPRVISWKEPVHERTVIVDEERTVYFGFNQAELTPESKARLDALAEKLVTADDVTGANIVGYADRIGTPSYNEALSKKRAKKISEYMVSRGFVKPSVMETRWVGEKDPSTNCPANLPHAELVGCLQPDRKVTVELKYKSEVETGD